MTESSLEEVPAAMRRVSGILDGAGGLPPSDGDADYLAGHEIGRRVHEAKSAASAIIKAPTIGSISEHPDGYPVDVVAEDSGCFFRYRVESDTLSRTAALKRDRGGRRRNAPRRPPGSGTR